MLNITPIPAFSDNYIWCIFDDSTNQAIVIDPGSADAVIDFLESKYLTLNGILITHHHADHTGGAIQLKTRYQCDIYGFKRARFSSIDKPFQDGDQFELLGSNFVVYEVPGHTLDHIAFYSAPDNHHASPWLFCGDTLFSGGCGRLFEGSAEQMQASLNRLSELPDTTEVYCAHEYTLANLAFAQSLMPENPSLRHYIEVCTQKRDQNQPTIPSTLATELAINPFLRSNDQELLHSLAKINPETTLTEANIFAKIREAKDQF